MSFNCIPCSVEQSRQMIFITKDDSINRFPDNTLLQYEYIIFRQDLPHQGVSYKKRNSRIFMYWDLSEQDVLIFLCEQDRLKCKNLQFFIRKGRSAYRFKAFRYYFPLKT